MGGWIELRWKRPRLRPDEPLGGNPEAGALGLCASQCLGSSILGGPSTCLTLLFAAQDTFWKNPQFLLSVWRPQEDRVFLMPCSVLVSLLQKPRHRHRNRKPHLAIGFYLFRVGGILGHTASPRVSSCCAFFSLPVFFAVPD